MEILRKRREEGRGGRISIEHSTGDSSYDDQMQWLLFKKCQTLTFLTRDGSRLEAVEETNDARGDAHWVGCGWYIDPARPFVETSKFDIIISVK